MGKVTLSDVARERRETYKGLTAPSFIRGDVRNGEISV